MAKKKTVSGIPDHEIEALARCLLPSIRDYFESAEGKREFAQWKAKQQEKQGGEA